MNWDEGESDRQSVEFLLLEGYLQSGPLFELRTKRSFTFFFFPEAKLNQWVWSTTAMTAGEIQVLKLSSDNLVLGSCLL